MKPIPVSFHIGPLLVHTYGIGLAITFWFSYRYFERRLRRNGYPTEWLTGMFLWVVVAAIVGARVVHVVSQLSYYRANPGQILAVWHGGLSSFGGLLFGVPTGVLLTRKRCPQLGVVKALDLVSPVLMAAWGVGRLLGPQLMVSGGGARTNAWYGMYYAGEVGKRVPVPLIQSIDSFFIFGVLLLLERRYRDRPTGFILSATAGLWGLARFYEEFVFLRKSSPQGSAAVEVAGLVLFGGGIVAMTLLMLRHRRHPAEVTGSADDADGEIDTPTDEGARIDTPNDEEPPASPSGTVSVLSASAPLDDQSSAES